jgi:hypothetical protein
MNERLHMEVEYAYITPDRTSRSVMLLDLKATTQIMNHDTVLPGDVSAQTLTLTWRDCTDDIQMGVSEERFRQRHILSFL